MLFPNPLLQLLNQLDTPLCRFLLAPEIEEALVWDGYYMPWPTTTATKDHLDFYDLSYEALGVRSVWWKPKYRSKKPN